MKNKFFFSIIPLVLFSLISFFPVMANPHEVLIRFWTDRNFNNHYCDEIMKVYFQNKTYTGGELEYTYTCYSSSYHDCLANITIPATGYYDLLITDGNINWDTNGCPKTNENYEYWATVQNGMLIDSDEELDYYINITLRASPRQFFWGTVSWKALVSALYFIALFAIIIIVEFLMIRQGGQPSGLLAVVMFLLGIILKLVLGI